MGCVSPTSGPVRAPPRVYAAAVPSLTQWVAFALASLLFIQVPGPSLLFTLGRALTVSLRDALRSVVGNALGLLAQVLLVALGLGAIVAASATAFTVLKLVGAAYVVWLGVQAIRHRGDARAALLLGERAPERAAEALRAGFVVGATNPKTIVFFVAFLPQFIDPGAPAGPQLALLGLLFAVLAVLSDSVWATLAGAARRWFARNPARLDAISATGGVMMIGLGASLAASE